MSSPVEDVASADRALVVETPTLETMAPAQIWSRNSSTDNLLEEELPLNGFPAHTFSYGYKNESGRKIPQAIAHRGYKAKFPENTLGAFKGAVKVGAQAIETDIHLSKDGVVVLSHDPDLKRCFGQTGKIIDHDWSYLQTLRTIKEPHQAMPRLRDLLEYLTEPGLEDIWILLDIKLDNNAVDVMRLISETIKAVQPVDKRPWNQRIVLGIWAAKYLPLCHDYLPTFPVAYIGYSLYCANKFFSVPNISFNMLHQILRTPCGSHFIAKAKRLKRPVYAWTVNDTSAMRWGVRKEIDGVITDDPKTFLEVRDSWHPGVKNDIAVRELLKLLWLNILATVFGAIFNYKYRLSDIPQQFAKGKRQRSA